MPCPQPLVETIDATCFIMESPSLFWPRTFDDRLLGSLERNGQLVPVLATSEGKNPCLLAGQRRVRALAALGRPVQTLFFGPLSPLEKGIIYLESNANESMNHGAQIRALRYFATCVGELTDIASLLGLSPYSRQWQVLMDWLALPRYWDDLLVMGHVPLILAPLLLRFSPEDLDGLRVLFQNLSWSRNNAVHLVTWIWETSRREGCTPLALMEALELTAMMGLDLSPKDTMTRMVEAVRWARYPRLCRQERSLRKRSRDVVAGSRWRLEQPDHFETRSVELSTRITSRKELEERVKELRQIAQDRVWSDWGWVGEDS